MLEHRITETADLVRLVQVAEMLPQYAAQSTAVVCNEVPKGMGDLYRLFVVLQYSDKPIVTGAFSPDTAPVMIEMLAADSGGYAALREKPRAIFNWGVSPPLVSRSGFAAQNLVGSGNCLGARGDHFDAVGRSGFPRNACGNYCATCGRMHQRNHNSSTGTAGFSRGLGRSPSHLRHAQADLRRWGRWKRAC